MSEKDYILSKPLKDYCSFLFPTQGLKDRIDSHCGDKKRTTDVLDSRQGYRTKFRQLKAKKRALIHLEREDAVKHGGVKDDDLAIEDEYEPERKVFCAILNCVE